MGSSGNFYAEWEGQFWMQSKKSVGHVKGRILLRGEMTQTAKNAALFLFLDK